MPLPSAALPSAGWARSVKSKPGAVRGQAVLLRRLNQAVDHGDRRRLCSCEPAAHHAEHDDQHCGQRPEGHAQLMDQVADAEFIALRIIPFYGNDIGAYHQGQG